MPIPEDVHKTFLLFVVLYMRGRYDPYLPERSLVRLRRAFSRSIPFGQPK